MKPDAVIVPRDLYEWLLDYALALQGEWKWKRNSTLRNNQEMAQMDEHIFKALQVREAETK